MRFRNSTRLLMENFKSVYKILLYKLIIGIVTMALTSALLLPGLMEILESAQMDALVSYVKEFFDALIGGNSAFLTTFQKGFSERVSALAELVHSKMSQIIWSLVGVGVVYLLGRFLDTLGYFAVGSILNDRMATYGETPFSAAYVKNLGRASIYSIVYVPIVFLFDVVTVALCWVLAFYFISFLNILFSLFFSVTLVVLCQSLKLTLTSMWLPAMASDHMSVGKAIRFGGRSLKKQWQKVFSTYIAAVYFVIIVNVVAAVCTFGSALLITVPASYFLFICIQFVNYYTVQGKKYFITYDRIATNRDHGDSEHFFDTVESADGEPEPLMAGNTEYSPVAIGLERASEIAARLDGKLEEAGRRMDAVLDALEEAEVKAAETAKTEPEEIEEEFGQGARGAEGENFSAAVGAPGADGEKTPPEEDGKDA